MPRICYVEKKFSDRSLATIGIADRIIDEYRLKGFSLTLRQLYYQFVARGIIPNKDAEYKKLGEIISDARLAGLIDWLSIVDRTRYVRVNSHWSDPASIVESAAQSYAIDKRADQEVYLEVWIEKDALVGVIEDVCKRWDVPFFSCRGYTSQSEMWVAAQRISKEGESRSKRIILHLGDHDPSGLDMSRDIQDRMNLFLGNDYVEVSRIALNMSQVLEYSPPPNPAKTTDSRSGWYIQSYGEDSWELDSMDPTALEELVEDAIRQHTDEENWEDQIRQEDKQRGILQLCSIRWKQVTRMLERRK